MLLRSPLHPGHMGGVATVHGACSLARERYRPTRGEGRGSPLTSDPIRISKLTVQDSECPLGSRVPGCVEHHQARRVCLPGSWREPLLHRRTVRPSDGLNRREYLQSSTRGRTFHLPHRLRLQGGGLRTRQPQPQDLGPGWPRQMLGRLVFHSSSPSCRKRQSWRRWRLGHTRV